MMKAVEAARARSGANVGPPKPISDEMLKRIKQNVDKDNRKTSRAESSDDVMYAKKGGMTAKGWGKARGARAAKVY